MSNGYDQEMYQELYAIRSRIECLNQIYQEMYSVRAEIEKMTSILEQIQNEISGLRDDLRSAGERPGAEGPDYGLRRRLRGDG